MYPYLLNLLGVDNWIIILGVVVLLFGGSKIPELMRGVGRGVGELQKGIHEGKQHLEDSMREVSKPVETPAEEPKVTVAEDAQPRS